MEARTIRPRLWHALALALLIASALPSQADDRPPRKVALLVGVNNYDRNGFRTLKWAENDAAEMSAELAKHGFKPIVVLKGSSPGSLRASRANIERQLSDLLKDNDVRKQDLVLVMLCGHGQQLPVPRRNGPERVDAFFCPVDAVIDRPETMISVTKLTDEMLPGFASHNIVLIDACRNTPEDNDRGTTRAIHKEDISVPKGTALMFSCDFDQVSLEQDRLRHGVFTYCVLQTFRKLEGQHGELTWGSLVEQVSVALKALEPKQEPALISKIAHLVLVKAASIRIPLPPPPPPASPRSTIGELRRLEGTQGLIRAVSISADGRFALACDDTRVRYYDVESGRDIIVNRLIRGTNNHVSCVALSPKGTGAVLGGADREVVLWDFEGRQEIRKFLHDGNIIDLAYSANGRFVITGSYDRLLRIWSTDTGQEVNRFSIEETDTSFSISADARVGVNGSKHGYAELWDVESTQVLRRFSGHDGAVYGVGLSGDARRLLTAGEDGTVRLWDAEDGRELHRLKGHEGAVYAAAISGDGRIGITGGADGTVRVWKLAP